METVDRAAKIGKENKVDFMIGIGGGSPIDAAKAIGVLINKPAKSAIDLFSGEQLQSLPLLAIPTTAGTGAEVAQWAVLTRNDIGTKQAISPKIFPGICFYRCRLSDGNACSPEPGYGTGCFVSQY